jgi:hypothetical protein
MIIRRQSPHARIAQNWQKRRALIDKAKREQKRYSAWKHERFLRLNPDLAFAREHGRAAVELVRSGNVESAIKFARAAAFHAHSYIVRMGGRIS